MNRPDVEHRFEAVALHEEHDLPSRIARARAGDQRLVEELRRGETGAVEALVERYAGLIYRIAVRVVGDPRDAEEVTQDVLMTVTEKIGTFRGEAAFSSWLYRIAANAAYERARARRRRPEVTLEAVLPTFDDHGRHVEPAVDWSRDMDDPAVAGETRAALERAITDLPEDNRVVLVLRDVEGLSNEQVAETLGLTLAAVKSRLHRARLFVRQALAHLVAPVQPESASRRRQERDDTEPRPRSALPRDHQSHTVGERRPAGELSSWEQSPGHGAIVSRALGASRNAARGAEIRTREPRTGFRTLVSVGARSGLR
jgi:RNA polymerase sigma-70 factor, ECF subfamily